MAAGSSSAADATATTTSTSQTREPGRNGGYVVYYRKPPIYVGQDYGPEVGPYHISKDQAYREITRLANNGNLLTRIGPW